MATGPPVGRSVSELCLIDYRVYYQVGIRSEEHTSSGDHEINVATKRLGSCVVE